LEKRGEKQKKGEKGRTIARENNEKAQSTTTSKKKVSTSLKDVTWGQKKFAKENQNIDAIEPPKGWKKGPTVSISLS